MFSEYLKKIDNFITEYSTLVNIACTIVMGVTVMFFVWINGRHMPVGFNDYTERVLNPSLVSIDDQHKVFIEANNEHARYCQAAFTAIKNNTDKILEKIEPLESLSNKIGEINIKKETTKEVVKDEIKVEVPAEENYNSAELALLPTIDEKTNIEKMKLDLRVILKKHSITDIEDIDNMQIDKYSLWINDYEKFVKKCEDGFYKKSWFKRLF
jgi:hypothetical protein